MLLYSTIWLHRKYEEKLHGSGPKPYTQWTPRHSDCRRSTTSAVASTNLVRCRRDFFLTKPFGLLKRKKTWKLKRNTSRDSILDIGFWRSFWNNLETKTFGPVFGILHPGVLVVISLGPRLLTSRPPMAMPSWSFTTSVRRRRLRLECEKSSLEKREAGRQRDDT